MEILQRRKLPELLKHFGLPLVAAEIGVAGGAFSQELLEEGIEKIYCIDNWSHIPNITGDGNFPQNFHDKSYKEYQSRFCGEYKDRVITLKGMSSEMHKYIPDKSLGLAYFDGGHQLEVIRGDIWNYKSKVVSGGIMAFHDYGNTAYGVKEAVEEFATLHKLTINNNGKY